MPSPSEAVVATSDINLRLNRLTSWEPAWRELDLVLGIAVDADGNQSILNPEYYDSVPRSGVQLADVTLEGSQGSDRIFVGVGSLVNAAGGSDELFNTESQGGNLLIGGVGSDDFFLQAANDVVIGGRRISESLAPRASLLYPAAAIVDQARDQFFILSETATGNTNPLSIVDYEAGIDQVFIDGKPVSDNWQLAKAELLNVGVVINAAPILTASAASTTLTLIPGVKTRGRS